MEWKTLDEWLDQYRQARIEYLNKLHELRRTFSTAYADAHNAHKTESVEVKDVVAGKIETRHVRAVAVEIDGKVYKHNARWRLDGRAAFFADNGIRDAAQADLQLLEYYTEAERLVRIEKDVAHKKAAVIAKVEKICTKDIAEISVSGRIYVKGANGRTAEVWAVFAGGYNIQCLHIRVLVKEVNYPRLKHLGL